MITLEMVAKMRNERGPRFLVTANLRREEFRAEYALTRRVADMMAERWTEDGCYMVEITAPEEFVTSGVVLRERARVLREAERSVQEKTAILRASVVQAAAAWMTPEDIADATRLPLDKIKGWLTEDES